MSLENLYNDAPAASYVGKVRTTQEANVGAVQGVNFMDGTRRSKNNQTSDAFQTEFKRNAAGAYVAGGAQPPARDIQAASSNGETPLDSANPSLTRWTSRVGQFAFNGSNRGPDSLINGFYGTPTIFRKDSKGNTIHNYAPLPQSTFGEKDSWAKSRIVAGPTST